MAVAVSRPTMMPTTRDVQRKANSKCSWRDVRIASPLNAAAPNPAPNDADGDSTGTLIAAMTATAALIGIGAVLVNSTGRKDAAPTNDRPLKSHL